MEPQQCWHLLALFACSLKPVKLLGPCKRTQHCWPTTPNNVGSCWHFLRPFAWALNAPLLVFDSSCPSRKSNNLYQLLLVCSTVFCFHSGVNQNQMVCHFMQINQNIGCRLDIPYFFKNSIFSSIFLLFFAG